jgi:hypothetical protein
MFIIQANDPAGAWLQLNKTMLNAGALQPVRLGNRHMVPNVTLEIKDWNGEFSRIVPLNELGYNPRLRMGRLERNYLNVESLQKCRAYMDGRRPDRHSTHGLAFGTGRKKTPPCMVGAMFYFSPTQLYVNVFIRASEVTKTLGADFHFLNSVFQRAVPDWMYAKLGLVRIHLGLAYNLAQWFPLFDMIAPGFKLEPEKYRFHDMCMQSIRKARDVHGYESKWKPERRMHLRYRERIPQFLADKQGRIVQGPSFFPCP